MKPTAVFWICAYTAAGTLGLYLGIPEMPNFQAGTRMFLAGWMLSAIVGMLKIRPNLVERCRAPER